MYTVIKSIAIPREFGTRWQEVNLATTSVVQIFQSYRKVYLTLTAAFLTEPIFVDMESFIVKYGQFTGTLADLFTDNGTQTLETIPEIPELNVKRAYFSDMFYSGYKVQLSEEAPYDKSSKIDLKITRPNTDVVELYDHGLFTVNGFFHYAERDNNFVYVRNGGNSMIRSGQNHIGLWSWLNVGKIKQLPITEDMLFKQHDTSTFSDRVYIKINEDLEKKTVLLFAGGYLVKPEKEIFFPIGNGIWCFNVGRTPLLRRYFESKKYINFEALELDSSSVNDSLISVEQFYNDNTLRKYMTLPQSFIAIIDKEDVYFDYHYVKHSKLPGMYISYNEPTYPLMTGAGKVSEYWKTLEDGQWAINVTDGYRQNKAFETALDSSLISVGDSNQSTNTHFNSKAYLLEAGSDY